MFAQTFLSIPSPTIKFISIIVAVIVFMLILILGLKTDLLKVHKVFSISDSQYSFSKFQLWIWTLIIGPCFVLYWGFTEGNIVDINQEGLVLLGISAGVTLTGGIITQAQLAAAQKKKLGGTIEKIELKLNNESISFWTDLLSDDHGQFSIARLQNLIFTLVYGVIYVVSFFANSCAEYPEFNPNAYLLMGISGGTFLTLKGLNR